MTTLIRRLVPFTLALGLLLALAPGVSALSARYPTESFGNRGSNVKAVQGFLITRGFDAPFDGVYAATTRDAVKAFQASKGLKVDGIVGEPTWTQLVITVRPGDSSQAVRVLQRQLNEKRRTTLTIDGVYGASTKSAVVAFQKHMKLTADGVVGGQTWRWLLWHYELPSFNATSLCDYSVGNGPADWATANAIGQLEAAAAQFAKTGHGRVAIGDAGYEHGGDIAGHMSHEVGLDIDIRPIRKADNQCTWGTNWRYSTYDRTATRTLIKSIRATASGHVKLIYFNDPVLIGEGLTTWFAGHDDHLHIRYCEPGYPSSMYRC